MDEILDDSGEDKVVDPFKLRTLLFWFIPLALGGIFRTLDWAGGAFLIVCSSAGITAYVIYGLFFNKGKNSLNQAMAILAGLWLAIFVWGAFFNGGYPYNKYGLQAYAITLAFVLGIYFLIWYLKKRRGG